ncbi:polysaccharide deacetylase [uncultured Sphingomonas sp.]|uniref:polysaccharide deacetylase n=1 Tax=uncultured Sphingomonas sp. TaxID=158754 RepID=UPI0035C94714
MTLAFLTIDTEFAWRHHQAGYGCDEIYRRSIEPAGVGIGHQLARLAEHRLKACFFVDPMSALTYGLDHVRRIVDTVSSAGQEVQLHLHPNWCAARPDDRGEVNVRHELRDYAPSEQRSLIAGAVELLVAAGAPSPVAFRAGSYAADDWTLAALGELGLRYDSSHNGACHPWPGGIGLDARQIAPVERGVLEVPVTVIEDAPGMLRTAQICALSAGEMRATIAHAAMNQHAAVTIVGHSFELANRAGTRPNTVHVRRFEALCETLDELRDTVPTTHFGDRPAMELGRDDLPLGPNRFRKRWRQAEQLWSNWVEERAA